MGDFIGQLGQRPAAPLQPSFLDKMREPRDPNGFAIDMARPALDAGNDEFKTERTIGIDMTEDGKQVFYNIPTVVNGEQLSDEEAIAAFGRGENAPVGRYDSQEQADHAAQQRSDEIGRLRGGVR